MIAPDFEYARELFIQVFKDDTPLVNCGYTLSQLGIAKSALSALEEESIRIVLTPPPAFVDFGKLGSGRSVELFQLPHGGYKLDAEYNINDYNGIDFFEFPYHHSAAIFSAIPENVGLEDIPRLVKNLYEGSDSDLCDTHMVQRNPLTQRLNSVLDSLVTFRAFWVDERTKIDLVVETNFTTETDRAEIGSEDVTHIWRRLPTQELEGQRWFIFGRKPNISKDLILWPLQNEIRQTTISLEPVIS